MRGASSGASFQPNKFVEVYIGESADDFRPYIPREVISVLPHADSPGRTIHLGRENGRAALCIDKFGDRAHGSTLPPVTSQRKREVTPRNSTSCNVFRMAERDWRALEGQWERLRWARQRWQNTGAVKPTAEHAAESLGIKPGTYRAYERGPDTSKHTPFGHQEAMLFGRKFKVSWTWLLLGQGSPFDDQLPEPQERVIRAMAVADPDQQEALADMVERLLRTGT